MPPSPAGTLRKLHEAVLTDIEVAVVTAVQQAAKEAVQRVIAEHLKELEGEDWENSGRKPGSSL